MMLKTKAYWSSHLAFGTAAVLALTLATRPLAAQPSPPPTDPNAKPSGDTQPSTTASAEARKEFDAGVALLEDPDGAKYEEAYRAFKRAYDISRSPSILGNIAFCAMHLERDGEALDAYRRYLSEGKDISERERAQIQKDLATMQATVATVKITVKSGPPGTRLLVDRRVQTRGPAIENDYTFEGDTITLRVHSGRHALKVTSAGNESSLVEATLEPGGTFATEVTLTKPEAPVGPGGGGGGGGSPIGPIILGGLGVVALGVGVGTGVAARSATSDIESNCPNDACPASYDLSSNRSSARRLGTIADISFIAGGALVAGAVVWYLLLPKGGGAAKPAAAASLKPGAMCTGTGCEVGLQGGF